MKLTRKTVFYGALGTAIALLGIGQAALQARANVQMVQAPRFEVDPFWPKPLPNHWVMGNVIGVGVDSRDHVYIVHRQDVLNAAESGAQQDPPLSECCKGAPPVLEFDPEGNLVRSWGGPGTG
jgi:hypothetical protein